MNERTRILDLNQLAEIRDYVTNRFEALFNKLHDVDSRFTFLPKSGYIRFTNIVDGTPVGSGAVVSWTAKWANAYTYPEFSFDDGSILSFAVKNESYHLLNIVNDSLLIVVWKHQLDYYCDKVYSDLMLALKEEADMKRRKKIWEIRRAANVFC